MVAVPPPRSSLRACLERGSRRRRCCGRGDRLIAARPPSVCDAGVSGGGALKTRVCRTLFAATRRACVHAVLCAFACRSTQSRAPSLRLVACATVRVCVSLSACRHVLFKCISRLERCASDSWDSLSFSPLPSFFLLSSFHLFLSVTALRALWRLAPPNFIKPPLL